MQTNPGSISEDMVQALAELAELRQFVGPAKEFWPRLNACAAKLSGADHLILVVRAAAAAPWKKFAEWSANRGQSRFLVAFTMQLEDVANRASREQSVLQKLEEDSAGNHFILGLRLKLHQAAEEVVLTVFLSGVNQTAAHEVLLRLNLVADTPELYQKNLSMKQAHADVEKFATVLDLTVPVNNETRFFASALAFCNGIATRFLCDRASLGWIKGGYIHLTAMSRTEKFDRQMAAAQALEKAMEECFDQDDEIVCPTPDKAGVVGRDHESYAKDQKVGHVCSLPLRVDGKPVAVLTCERQAMPFAALELQQMRLACDQVSRRLSDLKRWDRWFGARWADIVRERAAKIVGPEHTWAKLAGIGVALLLVVLFLLPVSYRVEGNFILRSDEVSFLTAPFDGYIEQVFVRTGDPVEQGGSLLALRTSELKLEEASALADLSRFEREAEKARAGRALADMRIAEASAEQSKARLDLIRYHISNANIRSPFAGVVVEGDLRERIAAPVKQGDALFKVARTEALYAEAEINERDVHEILSRSTGEIAFVSQPKLKYKVRITRVEPAALPKKDANVFLVRLTFEGGPQTWWRPGMSGLCKLDVEKRTLFWIITHRTVDFLRMKLWW
ncbi:MAG: HlyD family efflux transporter periplasmic adaptor subunit [Verrucomicrobia bacterium]|nr:HlyD family efflux transporter periplasmic adaptor subunit [Verrucomicrobiota bacterium]